MSWWTMTSIEALWDALEREGEPGGVRRVDESHPCDLYAGLDASGRRGLILVTDIEPPAGPRIRGRRHRGQPTAGPSLVPGHLARGPSSAATVLAALSGPSRGQQGDRPCRCRGVPTYAVGSLAASPGTRIRCAADLRAARSCRRARHCRPVSSHMVVVGGDRRVGGTARRASGLCAPILVDRSEGDTTDCLSGPDHVSRSTRRDFAGSYWPL